MRKKKTRRKPLPATITPAGKQRTGPAFSSSGGINSLHLAFVYRGARANAEKFLAAQDAFFAEPEAEAGGEEQSAGSPC